MMGGTRNAVVAWHDAYYATLRRYVWPQTIINISLFFSILQFLNLSSSYLSIPILEKSMFSQMKNKIKIWLKVKIN